MEDQRNSRLVALDSLHTNVRAADDVYGPNSNMLIAQGTVLSERLIDRLSQHGITHMWVERFESQEKEIVHEAAKDLERLYRDVRSGKSLNKKVVKKTVDGLIEKVLSHRISVDLLATIKDYDHCTYSHSVHVSVFSALIAREMGVSEENILQITMAGLLHDVGKCFVPQEILNKQGPLTHQEYSLVKTHTEKGYRYLKQIGYSDGVALPVLQHHEKSNGKGYPYGLGLDAIRLDSRIVAVADYYDALTYDRPYRKAIDPLQSLRIMREIIGLELCPQSFKALLKGLNIFPPETRFILNSGVELSSWVPDRAYSPLFRFDSCTVPYREIAHLVTEVVV